MQSWRLTVFVNAYKIRLRNGETLEEIDTSYPRLTTEEKEEIHKNLE